MYVCAVQLKSDATGSHVEALRSDSISERGTAQRDSIDRSLFADLDSVFVRLRTKRNSARVRFLDHAGMTDSKNTPRYKFELPALADRYLSQLELGVLSEKSSAQVRCAHFAPYCC